MHSAQQAMISNTPYSAAITDSESQKNDTLWSHAHLLSANGHTLEKNKVGKILQENAEKANYRDGYKISLEWTWDKWRYQLR